jgi:aryl-alcohol dehydrogenase-like predicted oxidoreductase
MIRYPRQLPIVGPRKVEDLDESLSASEVTLTAEQVDFLTADP